MTPVVNGIKSKFSEVVEVRSLDAGFGTGQQAFSIYGLPGHPSYLILDPTGEVLWKSFGPQSRETLISAVEDAIAVIQRSP